MKQPDNTRRKPPEHLPIILFADWLVNGQTGLSSMSIVSHVTGNPCHGFFNGLPNDFAPYDYDDFDRCMRLIKAVPLVRPHLHVMRDVSDEWKRIIDRFDELETAYKDTDGEDADSRRRFSTLLSSIRQMTASTEITSRIDLADEYGAEIIVHQKTA